MIDRIAEGLSIATCFVQLILGAIFCITLKMFFITRSKHIAKTLLEKNEYRDVSPFAAVTVALAGTLGVGNIVGVAASIHFGGAGSIFWMWVGAFFSMVLKYAEVVLSIKYRVKEKHEYLGGAFNYMKPKGVSTLFALLCICASFSIGNFLQMNTLSDILQNVCNVPKLYTGIFTFIIISVIIGKNIKIISKFTSIVVPIASIVYVVMCLTVIIKNYEQLPGIISMILRDAFDVKAGVGGAFALVFSRSMRYGITRGLITNEAGCGTAPIAHACADTDSAVRQGFWGIFEVFFDTFILCSLSAFVILSDTSHSFGYNIDYILGRFSSVFGRSSDYLLTACIIMFATSTLIGWSQYGAISLKYVSKNQKSKHAYLLIYALLAILGSIITSKLMWNIADITIGIMTLINSFFLFKKLDEIKAETFHYFKPHGKRK